MPATAAKKKPAAKSKLAKKVVKITRPTKKAAVELKIGAAVPDFSMPATKVKQVSRDSLKGKPFVIYFYPKDNTSGCTAQACGFTEALPAFTKLGIPVIGVSKDDLKSHENFSKKFKLNFPLASDETGKVCAAFGVWIEKNMYGRKYMGIERATFLVDGKGTLRQIWRKVSVPGHVAEVKKAAQAL